MAGVSSLVHALSAPMGIAMPRRALCRVRDERLVEQVRAGSRRAFEAVYDRHHAGILAFCRHMLGSREEAEDVVQHTFIAAYRALLTDDEDVSALKPWLYAIARNRCVSVLRVRREHVGLEDAETWVPATAGLSAEVEQRADLRALLYDLQRLPDDQRAALVLAELGAESYDEIALILDVPTAKIKALVFQAREGLMNRRLAPDADCASIREQLSVLRGGARRRSDLRQHVAQCEGCRAFEAEVRRQRAGMAVLLPVVAIASPTAVTVGYTGACAAREKQQGQPTGTQADQAGGTRGQRVRWAPREVVVRPLCWVRVVQEPPESDMCDRRSKEACNRCRSVLADGCDARAHSPVVVGQTRDVTAYELALHRYERPAAFRPSHAFHHQIASSRSDATRRVWFAQRHRQTRTLVPTVVARRGPRETRAGPPRRSADQQAEDADPELVRRAVGCA